jgi:hypothetical protein
MGSDFARATHHCLHALDARRKQKLQCALDEKSSSHESRQSCLHFLLRKKCYLYEERNIAVASKRTLLHKERSLLGARGAVVR